MKQVFVIAFFGFAALLSACSTPSASRQANGIFFNQHELERLLDSNGTGVPVASSHEDAGPREPGHDGWEMLSWVAGQLPGKPIVYPSEGYYYFKAYRDGTFYSGNMRVIESSPPTLSFAYFDVLRPRDFRSVIVEDGTDERVSIREIGNGRYELKILDRVFDWQIDLTRRDPDLSIPLLPDERLISGVLDESGTEFLLVFNDSTSTFHYLLRDPLPRASGEWRVIRESAVGVVAQNLRTKFIVYKHRSVERWTLIGVSQQQISANTYFDGPFDQVPPNLSIGEELRAAYPYVKAGAGINDHGEFLGKDRVRVAISPYQAYFLETEVLSEVEAAETSDESDLAAILARLCFELKREFRASNGKSAGGESTRHWPANHFATVSRTWLPDHGEVLSNRWGPNHRRIISESED